MPKRSRQGCQIYAKSGDQSPGEQTLALHYGKYMNSQSYVWGRDLSNPAQKHLWPDLFHGDWNSTYVLRVDFNEYELQDQNPWKCPCCLCGPFLEQKQGFPCTLAWGLGVGAFFANFPMKATLAWLSVGRRSSFDGCVWGDGILDRVWDEKPSSSSFSDGQLNGTYLSGESFSLFWSDNLWILTAKVLQNHWKSALTLQPKLHAHLVSELVDALQSIFCGRIRRQNHQAQI